MYSHVACQQRSARFFLCAAVGTGHAQSLPAPRAHISIKHPERAVRLAAVIVECRNHYGKKIAEDKKKKITISLHLDTKKKAPAPELDGRRSRAVCFPYKFHNKKDIRRANPVSYLFQPSSRRLAHSFGDRVSILCF